jgi:oligosaccharide repeat unit polymerase
MVMPITRFTTAQGDQARKRHQPNWLAISYGAGLTAFLLVALNQASGEISEYPLEILLCLVNGGLSIYGQLMALRREAPLHLISFFFCFIFMSAAPIVQLGAQSAWVFSIDHLALLAVINGLMFTLVGIFFTYRLGKSNNKISAEKIGRPTNLNYLLVFATVVAVSAVAIGLFRSRLFTDRTDFYDATMEIFGDAATGSLATTFLMSTPIFAAIIGLRSAIASRDKIWTLLFSSACILAAVPNNPLIQPRYHLAGLAFFFIDYMFYGKRTKAIVLLLIAGVLLAPVFQTFRYSNPFSQESISDDAPPSIVDTLRTMDYDAFTTSCYTLLTVREEGISWGSNILGAVAFFVPRALWPGKPPPTSWVIYDTMTHSSEVGTDNLSTPLMAEGYYAFGWIGAVAISLLFWWCVSEIMRCTRDGSHPWIFLLRCVFSGLVLIILRGTLTVGVSALASSFVAAAIPMFLIEVRLRRSRHRSKRLLSRRLQ